MKKRTELIIREGNGFIIASGALFLLSLLFNASAGWQILFFFLLAFFLFFFRNPERIPDDQSHGVILAPSDGEVLSITECIEPFFTQKKMIKISIRLNLLDLHIQRAPSPSIVEKIEYVHGTFLSLTNEKASELNEQQRMLFRVGEYPIVTNQIAGFITRRILSFVSEEMQVRLAQRFGMIMFGSQVDLYLPENVTLKVVEGEPLVAGESVVGFFYEG